MLRKVEAKRSEDSQWSGITGGAKGISSPVPTQRRSPSSHIKRNRYLLRQFVFETPKQISDPQFASISFEDRFSILVDAEWTTSKSNHLTSLIKDAGYAIPGASAEDIEYLPERKLVKSQILRLASCTYIQEAHNVILLGATGAGKTYLACALGMAANRNFYISKYIQLWEAWKAYAR